MSISVLKNSFDLTGYLATGTNWDKCSTDTIKSALSGTTVYFDTSVNTSVESDLELEGTETADAKNKEDATLIIVYRIDNEDAKIIEYWRLK